MSKQWLKVKLGEIVRQEREQVGINNSNILPVLGITNVEGVTQTGVKASDDKSKYLRLRPGRFVYNPYRINVGSIGLSAESQDGICSPAYVVFVPMERIDAHFLLFFFKSARGNQLINFHGNRGTVRSALRFEDLCKIEIPLPPLAEQRRIVARIEELAGQIQEARNLRQKAGKETESLLFQATRTLFPVPKNTTVCHFIRFQTGYAFKSEWFTESGIRLARNANVGHGILDWNETVYIPEELRSQFSAFELQSGDILISLDRPIISTGVKVALVRDGDLPCMLLQRVARAVFKNDTVVPDYFYRWLRSPHFFTAIDPGRSNGVPHISHKDIEKIPFNPPTIPEQHRIVAELDAVQAEVDALKRLQAETSAEMDALLPAILDRAFKGEL